MLPDLARFQRDFAMALDRPAEGGMAVYRNTVIHGAVEALRANHPVVEQILGAEMFEHVAVDFSAAFPPSKAVLAQYGCCEFPDWLREQSWVSDLPYLPDVAAIEALHVASLMSADAEPLNEAQIRAACRAPSFRPRMHPAARFSWLQTPAMSIWLAHQRPMKSEIAPDWKAEGALFSRPEPFVMHALRIGRAAHRLLFGIRLGETVSASMAAASRLYPEEDCSAVFASLVNLGAFVAPAPERK